MFHGDTLLTVQHVCVCVCIHTNIDNLFFLFVYFVALSGQYLLTAGVTDGVSGHVQQRPLQENPVATAWKTKVPLTLLPCSRCIQVPPPPRGKWSFRRTGRFGVTYLSYAEGDHARSSFSLCTGLFFKDLLS